MVEARSKTFRFTNFHIENWRNFACVGEDLQRREFLVGPNASGKSNFLDVFRFLHDIVSVGGGFQEAIRRRGGVSSLRCLAARRRSDILIRVRLGSDQDLSVWEYELQFNQDSERQPYIKKERVVLGENVILDRPDREDESDRDRLSQTHLEQINVNRKFREMVDFFRSIHYLHIVPQLVREPDRSVGRRKDPFGSNFLEQVAAIQERTRNARLRRIREALCVAVPQLRELDLQRDVRGAPHLLGKYEHWRPQGAWQSEESFSDGTLRLLGLLWALLDGAGPLLLEEPELSLHPEVVRFIPQMFARIQRRSGRQVLASTHSSDLLRDEGIGLDEVLLLEPGSEGTSIHTASSFSEIKSLLDGGSNMAEAVMPRTRPKKLHQLSLFPDKLRQPRLFQKGE